MARKSVGNAMEAIASVSSIATSAAAGIAIETKKNPEKIPQDEIPWSDDEERNYREWLKEAQSQQPQKDVDWKELEDEESYRTRLKEEIGEEDDVPLNWEDIQERIYRRKYIEMRRNESTAPAEWNEYKAEEDYRENMRRRTSQSSSKVPIVWDDEDERKCQENYRKMYSSS